MIKLFILLMLVSGNCYGNFKDSLEQASYKTDIDLYVSDYIKEFHTVDYKLLPQCYYYEDKIIKDNGDGSYVIIVGKIASTFAFLFWGCGAKWGYDQKTNYGNITGTYFAIRSAKELYDAIFIESKYNTKGRAEWIRKK